MIVYLSASQISSYDPKRDGGCHRKWALKSLAKQYTEQTDSARLGTEVDDEQIQPYLRDGRSFDFSKPARAFKTRSGNVQHFIASGEIAASMLPYLPPPKSVEIQHRFELVSPSNPAILYRGDADIWAKDSAVLPGCAGGVPGVADTKTTKSIKDYSKSANDLLEDVQSMLYAKAAIVETGAPTIDLDWIYGQTFGTSKAKQSVVRVDVAHVEEQFQKIDAVANEIATVRKSAEGEPDKIKFALSLAPNPDACTSFGGCPYQSKCNLGPAAKIAAYSGKSLGIGKETNMSALANLSAILNAKKVAAAPPAAVVAPPAAAPAAVVAPPAAAPAALPAWATAPTDPMRAAHAAGQPYKADAPIGINPPESALPPAPPVGQAAASAEPAKRTRRTKAEMEAARAAAGGQPEGGDAPEAVYTPHAPEAVSYTWGPEKIQPAAYNDLSVGPFTATTNVRPGESSAAALERLRGEVTAFAEAERTKRLESFAATLTAVLS